MTARDFCYWLQGYFELTGFDTLNEVQVKQVKAHLGMVFRHEIDPSFGPPVVVAELTKIHESSKAPSLSDIVGVLGKSDGGGAKMNC